jgi:succinate dehydrogenase / fumarate reductase membrane anchor subunit
VKFFRFDRLAWIFMRVSGVVLIGLIFTHLIVNLMQDGGVKAIDFAFVAGKLASTASLVADIKVINYYKWKNTMLEM